MYNIVINSVHGYMIAEASCCQSRLAFCLCFFRSVIADHPDDTDDPANLRSSLASLMLNESYAYRIDMAVSLKLGETPKPLTSLFKNEQFWMIFSFSISHFGEPMDTVYMDHRPRVCAYAIAWHNSLSLIEYVDCVGSRPFLGGVRKGRCCYQGAGDGTQEISDPKSTFQTQPSSFLVSILHFGDGNMSTYATTDKFSL